MDYDTQAVANVRHSEAQAFDSSMTGKIERETQGKRTTGEKLTSG
jgi:hypothetical protein